MNNEAKSFVILKYQILSEDRTTWNLAETYPKIVCFKWMLRCSRDVEHLAKHRCSEIKKTFDKEYDKRHEN
jgi:hypothetical protein